ncbi:Cas9 inhibitor AcrIIA9 family protein [uncultured Thomasclavelia sp.]|uniref:Cas9 inhibitor AcrIIA9 family protein n=1 Tax=uncultured Thomasclavelia sp. TaxID=3025759 RepID=UPI0026060711|nr:Cas9 inhibitor AcrIIA9 family protein [uncultured Thomasclavelia sp.]
MDKFNEELKNATNPWIKRIGEYLLTRDDLKGNLKKENKTLSECFDYVLIELSKKTERKNGVGYVAGDDQEIYELAIHYYDEDEIVVGKKNFKTNADGSANPAELANNDQAKNTATEEKLQEKINKEVAKALNQYKKEQQEKLKKQKDAKKAKKETKNIDANQLNLFDLL